LTLFANIAVVFTMKWQDGSSPSYRAT